MHEGRDVVDGGKQNDLRKALVILDDAGDDRAEAMRKLINRVAVAMNVDPTHVVNMPLADFVRAVHLKHEGK